MAAGQAHRAIRPAPPDRGRSALKIRADRFPEGVSLKLRSRDATSNLESAIFPFQNITRTYLSIGRGSRMSRY